MILYTSSDIIYMSMNQFEIEETEKIDGKALGKRGLCRDDSCRVLVSNEPLKDRHVLVLLSLSFCSASRGTFR